MKRRVQFQEVISVEKYRDMMFCSKRLVLYITKRLELNVFSDILHTDL